MKVKIKDIPHHFPPDLGVWIKENLLILLTFTKVPWEDEEGIVASGWCGS